METIHSRIKSTRIGLGMSQAVLADKTGVSQPTVANWENGSHIPRQTVLEKISQILEVSESWLLTGIRDSNEIPSQIYLQTPIRHVPVFEWPLKTTDISSAAPIGFIPFASQKPNLLGIIKSGDRNAGFTVLICNPDAKRALQKGSYFSDENGQLSRQDWEAEATAQSRNIYAHIVAELTYYS